MSMSAICNYHVLIFRWRILLVCYTLLNSALLILTKASCIVKVTFGTLFNDDECANIFEALVGTLRAAKKRKVLTYEGELLLQGVHDNVEIILSPASAAAET